jgi:hypothetical protein
MQGFQRFGAGLGEGGLHRLVDPLAVRPEPCGQRLQEGEALAVVGKRIFRQQCPCERHAGRLAPARDQEFGEIRQGFPGLGTAVLGLAEQGASAQGQRVDQPAEEGWGEIGSRIRTRELQLILREASSCHALSTDL